MSEIEKPDKMIITPEEANNRITASAGKGGKYAVSRAEAVSISVQIGQQVYDQLRGEHALAMQQLQEDLSNHLNNIREHVALNLLDLQQRSVSYRIRTDIWADWIRFRGWLRTWWDQNPAYWWYLFLGWLELHGLRQPPKPDAVPAEYPDVLTEREPEHVGAPTEISDMPEIARVLVLEGGKDEAP